MLPLSTSDPLKAKFECSMSKGEIWCPGAWNEPVNSSETVPSNTTVSRGPLDTDTFGARAPIPPRVILPVCFDPSNYSKRVRIANVMWRVGGVIISYKTLIYPLRPIFRSMPVCYHFLGVEKIMCLTEEGSFKEKLVTSSTKLFFSLYCGRPAARSNFEAFKVRGRNLGNSHPFRCVCCNSREEITHCTLAPRR